MVISSTPGGFTNPICKKSRRRCFQRRKNCVNAGLTANNRHVRRKGVLQGDDRAFRALQRFGSITLAADFNRQPNMNGLVGIYGFFRLCFMYGVLDCLFCILTFMT